MSTSKTKTSTRNYSYICVTCKTPYTGHREQADKSKRFCKDSCRKAKSRQAEKAAKRQSRLEVQKIRWSKSTVGKFVIEQCRRAGSVAVLWGNTTASLVELDNFNNAYQKCYGYNREERKSLFHRSHIQASAGADGSTGALHHLNLFISQDVHNQKAGNKFVSADAGLRVPASKLIKRWEVSQGDTRQQITNKIHALLGDEFTNYVNQHYLIEMDTVHTLAQRIYNRQQKGTAVKELDQRYTLAQLEQESLETLEIMDAIQRGKNSVSSFRPERYTRATLCVYADELERMATVSLSERHRDNCRFMLALVRVLGIYIAQAETQQGIEHRDFLPLKDMQWSPLEYVNWQQPWGTPNQQLIDADHRLLIESIIEHCYHALSGADVPRGFLQARLLKRIDVATLVPTVRAPEQWRYAGLGSWESFIESLYSDAEPVWQSLLALDLCTTAQVEEARTGLMWSLQGAIEKARHEYRNSDCFKRTYKEKYYNRWGFKGYPEHLEFPPILADLMQPGAEVENRAAA
ncbi:MULTISPECIES: hypothetical protein [Pseudomonas]|uniref:Uncharacterized protein n=1 Tax=Pseudomonas juntendi TaxID=2666183 RepID=A0A7W2QX24_9PSED|nr:MULTISPECIES: hypothetical protein [Pseudomonas]MBA6145798.1 hypothetical protein [Pseudomonas juntendi]MDG9810614.1 hypothetical protein [Pseudomonas juntendi]